jgi:hypothetical protein
MYSMSLTHELVNMSYDLVSMMNNKEYFCHMVIIFG